MPRGGGRSLARVVTQRETTGTNNEAEDHQNGTGQDRCINIYNYYVFKFLLCRSLIMFSH